MAKVLDSEAGGLGFNSPSDYKVGHPSLSQYKLLRQYESSKFPSLVLEDTFQLLNPTSIPNQNLSTSFMQLFEKSCNCSHDMFKSQQNLQWVVDDNPTSLWQATLYCPVSNLTAQTLQNHAIESSQIVSSVENSTASNCRSIELSEASSPWCIVSTSGVECTILLHEVECWQPIKCLLASDGNCLNDKY